MEEHQSPTPHPPSRIDIVGWLGRGWEIYKKDWPPLSAAALIMVTVLFLAQLIPYAGALLFSGPMYVGYYLVLGDAVAGRKINPVRVFQGFGFFLPAFLAYLFITIFTVAGLMLFIIPGLVIGGWYLLTYLFIIDRGLDFWAAMEESRKTAWEDMVGMTIFFATLGLINLMGAMMLGVGLMVTIPVTSAATLVAYRELAGFQTLFSSAGDDAAASGSYTAPASGGYTAPSSGSHTLPGSGAVTPPDNG